MIWGHPHCRKLPYLEYQDSPYQTFAGCPYFFSKRCPPAQSAPICKHTSKYGSFWLNSWHRFACLIWGGNLPLHPLYLGCRSIREPAVLDKRWKVDPCIAMDMIQKIIYHSGAFKRFHPHCTRTFFCFLNLFLSLIFFLDVSFSLLVSFVFVSHSFAYLHPLFPFCMTRPSTRILKNCHLQSGLAL